MRMYDSFEIEMTTQKDEHRTACEKSQQQCDTHPPNYSDRKGLIVDLNRCAECNVHVE